MNGVRTLYQEVVQTGLCTYCGTCVAACPASAITGKGFSDVQIIAELEGLLEI